MTITTVTTNAVMICIQLTNNQLKITGVLAVQNKYSRYKYCIRYSEYTCTCTVLRVPHIMGFVSSSTTYLVLLLHMSMYEQTGTSKMYKYLYLLVCGTSMHTPVPVLLVCHTSTRVIVPGILQPSGMKSYDPSICWRKLIRHPRESVW